MMGLKITGVEICLLLYQGADSDEISTVIECITQKLNYFQFYSRHIGNTFDDGIALRMGL
jgi:hypothetical protein